MARRNTSRQARRSESVVSEPEEPAPPSHPTKPRRVTRRSATPSSIPAPASAPVRKSRSRVASQKAEPEKEKEKQESEPETQHSAVPDVDESAAETFGARGARRKSRGLSIGVSAPKRGTRASTTPATPTLPTLEEANPTISARAARARARASSDARTFAAPLPRTPRSTRRRSNSRQLSEEPVEAAVPTKVERSDEKPEPESDPEEEAIEQDQREPEPDQQSDQDEVVFTAQTAAQDKIAETNKTAASEQESDNKTTSISHTRLHSAPDSQWKNIPQTVYEQDEEDESGDDEMNGGHDVRISVEEATPQQSEDDQEQEKPSDTERAGTVVRVHRSLSPAQAGSPSLEGSYSHPSVTSSPVVRTTQTTQRLQILIAESVRTVAVSDAESSSPFNLQSQLRFDICTEPDEESYEREESISTDHRHLTSSPGPSDTLLMADVSSPMNYSPVNQLVMGDPASDSESSSEAESDASETRSMSDGCSVVKQEKLQSDMSSVSDGGMRYDAAQTSSIISSSPRPVSEPPSSPPPEVPHEAITLDDDDGTDSEDQEEGDESDADDADDTPGDGTSDLFVTTTPTPATQTLQIEHEPESTPVSSSPPSQFDQEIAFHELSPIVEVPEPSDDEYRRREEHLTPLSSSPPSKETPKNSSRFSLFGTPSISMIFNRGAADSHASSFARGKKRSLDLAHYDDEDAKSDSQDEEPSQSMKRRRTKVDGFQSPNREAEGNPKVDMRNTAPSTYLQPWRLPSLTPQKTSDSPANQSTPDIRSNSVPPMQTPFQTPKQRPIQTPFETPGGHVQVAVTEEQASWYSSFMTPIRNFFQSKPTGKIRGFTLNIIPGRKSNSSSSSSSTPVSATPSNASSFGVNTPRPGRPANRSWVPPHLAGEISTASSPSISNNRNRVSIRDIKRGQTEHLIEQLKKLSPQPEDLELVMESWKHAKYMAEKSAAIDARRAGFQFVLRSHPGATNAAEADLRQSEKAYDEHLRQYEPSVVDVIRGRIKAAWNSQQDTFRWSPNTDTVERVDAADRRKVEVGGKRDERVVEPFEEEDEALRPAKRARPSASEPATNSLQLTIGSTESKKSGTSKAVRFLSPRSQSAQQNPDHAPSSTSPLTPTPAVKTIMRTTPHPKSTLSHVGFSSTPQSNASPFAGTKWTPAQHQQLRRTGHVPGTGTFCVPEGGSDDEDDSDEARQDPLSTPGFSQWSEEKKAELRRTGHIPNTGVFVVPEFSDVEDEGSSSADESVLEKEPSTKLPALPAYSEREKPYALASAPSRKTSQATADTASAPSGVRNSSSKESSDGAFNVFAAAVAEPAGKLAPAQTRSSSDSSSAPPAANSTETATLHLPAVASSGSLTLAPGTHRANKSSFPSTSGPAAVRNPDHLTGKQVLDMVGQTGPEITDIDQVVWPGSRPIEDLDLERPEVLTAQKYLTQMWSQVC